MDSRRDFIYVDDMVWVAVQAASQGRGVYHVSSGSDYPISALFQAVADDLGPRLATLQAAIIAADPAEISRIAHAIKGGCAMVGLTRIRNTAAALEAGVPRETWLAHLAELHNHLRELNDILMMESPEQI